MNVKAFSIALLLASTSLVRGLPAAQQKASIVESKESFALRSKHLTVELSTTRPQLLRLSVDSLGLGRFPPSALQASGPGAAAHHREAKRNEPGISPAGASPLRPRPLDLPARRPRTWRSSPAGARMIRPNRSCWSSIRASATRRSWAGSNADGSVRLPALLHLPDQGTFRIAATDWKDAALGYDARRAGRATMPGRRGLREDHVSPGDTRQRRQVEYRWEVAAIYPPLAGIAERSPLRWLPPQLAQHPAIEPAICGCWPIMRAATPPPSATTSTPTSPGTRRRWPRASARWTWCARAWIGSWKACRPTVCPIM